MQDLKMSDRLLLIFMLMLVTCGPIIVPHGHAEIATPRLGGLGDNSGSFQNNRSDHQVQLATERSSPASSTDVAPFGTMEKEETRRRRHSVENSISSNPVRLAVAMKALELENNQLKFTLKELQATTEKFATRWQESNFAISQLTAVSQQQQLAIGQLQLQVSQLSTNTMKLQDENEVLHAQLRSLQVNADSHHEQTQSQLLKVSNLTSVLQAENSSIYTQLLQLSNLTSELRAEDRSIHSQLCNITDLTTGLYTENSSIYTQLQALTTDVIDGKRREETERLGLLEKVGKLQAQSSYLESNMSKQSSALEERLTSQVIQLQQKDQELMQKIINRTHVDVVGFHARLRPSIDAKTTGTLVLDSVEFNIGGGYNSATGIFTAPVTGVYLFLANMAADATGKSAWIKIVSGQTEICKTWSRYSTEIEMASCHAATSVIKGNQVRIVMDGSPQYKIRGALWTTFTGVLIKS